MVNYMHFSTIAIAIVSMCDHMCETMVRKVPNFEELRRSNKSIVGGLEMQLTYDESHEELDYLEFAGEAGSIGLTWLHITEDQMVHQGPNGTVIAYCTWRQLRNCQRYKMNHTIKAMIFSSAFWSCLLFQIPCGIIINKIGGYWVLLGSTIGIGIINLVLPVLSSITEWFVILLRFLLGALSAASMPAQYKLVDEWMLASDKGLSLAMIIASQTMGRTVILSMSGYLIEYFDWPSLMYSSCIITAFVTIGLFFIRNKPSQVSWLSEVELNIIEQDKKIQAEGQSSNKSDDKSTPWIQFFTNKPYMSLLLLFLSSYWNFVVYSNELPLFLDQMSSLHITTSGILNAGTNVTRVTSLLISGWLSEKLISSTKLSRTSVRKIFGCVLGFGQAICLILIPFVASNTPILSFILLLSTFTSGMASGSILPLHYELSTNYAVVLLSISDTTGYATGIIVPVVVSVIQAIFASSIVIGWQIIFILSASIAILANIVFLTFIKAERQPFDLRE